MLELETQFFLFNRKIIWSV